MIATNSPRRGQPTGLAAFVVVWIGQIISIVASNMSWFALTIWVFQMTQSATAMGLAQVFFITPFLLITPIAGVMVDRYNRKLMMMVSDLGAGVATIFIFLMSTTGQLQLWHLYLYGIIAGTFSAFQWPAYSASISLMVPKAQLGRANGLMSLMEAGPSVFAPLLAGALIGIIGLNGILTIDIVTFVFAVGALMIVFVPQPPRTEEGRQGKGNLLKEAAFGFRYIFDRPSLLGLQLVFFVCNLFGGVFNNLVAPMILSHTGGNSLAFGTVQTAGAIGGVAGGILMSVWGGFRRRVWGVLLGWAWVAVFGQILFGFGRDVPLWAAASFLGLAASALINGSNQAIWQSKVAPDVQGRVFSARRLIAWFTSPVTPLIAGPLADVVMEPAMRNPNSAMAQTLGGVFGVGPGAGMSIIMVASGICILITVAVAMRVRVIRNAESLLPDQLPENEAVPAAA
jgi:MFS family permease